MTLDGFCDHTAVDPDAEIHDHYTSLVSSAGMLLYGSTTYQLMQFWQSVINNPTGKPALDNFAVAIDKVPKLVFSHKLKALNWSSAKLALRSLEEEVVTLKNQSGKPVFACSPSLIVALSNFNLIDEYQICLHPILAGGGLPLFRNLQKGKTLNLVKTKTFVSGAILLYYQPKETNR